MVGEEQTVSGSECQKKIADRSNELRKVEVRKLGIANTSGLRWREGQREGVELVKRSLR